MKRIKNFIFVILLTFIFSIPLNVLAETMGTVKGTNVQVRSEASAESTSLAALTIGDTVSLIDTNKYPTTSGTACSEGWYKINYNSSIAYVCSTYVTIPSDIPGYNTSGWVARINNSNADIYTTPSFSSASLKKLPLLSNVAILDTATSTGDCPTIWYKVKYSSLTGYVCGRNITFREGIILEDATYGETLRTLGFPESYWPYLSYLHNKYPNWSFVPSFTNLNWNDVVRGEAYKNLIKSTDDNLRVDNIPREGSSWFYSKDSVNAFYMDPRNFLQENYIFMFEKLNYDTNFSSIYPTALKALFGSSYLSADEYVNYFINAGYASGVSPVHLAARSNQEGASDASYNSVSGVSNLTYRGYSLVGYYNFYNIGSRADDYTDTPTARGLAYAAGLIDGTTYDRPWTTREKAIMGGAGVISNGYITKGQHTLYYQKFNTSPTATNAKYTHQYMTNVQAPSSEASKTFSSYKDDVITNQFIFEIPIYNAMPDFTSLPSGGSSNNYLSKITINGITLNNFDKDVIEYTYYVKKEDTSAVIEATAENTLSAINGNATISLASDKTKAYINVTSENGEVKTYSIEIIKVDDITSISEIMKKISYKNTSDYIYGIEKGSSSSALINNILSNSPSSIITLKSASGTIIQNNSPLATGQMITVLTTEETQTFDIVVTGDLNGDGEVTILDLLKVQKHILKSSILSDAYLKASDTNNDNAVDILDLLRVQKYILGEIKF